ELSMPVTRMPCATRLLATGDSAATAEIEHACAFVQQRREAVVPFPVAPAARPSVGIPFGSVTLVMSDDLFGEVVHARQASTAARASRGSSARAQSVLRHCSRR